MTYEEILKQYWHYDSFRGIQLDIIESITSGHDTLGLMPTGGGKSITFQVPALAKEGTCLVISPLIALMKDQVEHLRQKGIKATAVYSGLSHEQVVTAFDNCILGDYKLLYISPERIGTDFFQQKLRHMNVSFICVDEAHCISEWGHDFRPSYLDIKQLRHLLPDAPILALTATATAATVKDIEKQLEFRNGKVYRMSFERKNLAYLVRLCSDKENDLRNLLNHHEGSTIVYCQNRERCKELARLIESWGITATFYHARLHNAEKNDRQNNWQRGHCRVMVATNAFGMGIDKPDVRLVVHMGLPNSIEAYFQEAGRAGRDGGPAEAILLYNNNDLIALKRKPDDDFPPQSDIRDIYDEVCCFLKVALGYGQGVRKEFNLLEYCRNFHRFSLPVENALMLLSRAGYIRYTDADEGISRLKFIVRRDELYNMQEQDTRADAVVNCIMRNYPGVFVDFIVIDESLISKQCGITSHETYQVLMQLSHRHIINYIPRKSIPHIEFVQPRFEKQDIVFKQDVYDIRRDILIEHLRDMMEYVTEDDLCRNRFLLDYFGEKSDHDCGECDICRKNALLSKNSKCQQEAAAKLEDEKRKIHNEVIRQIEAAGRIHPFMLELDDFDSNLAPIVLQEMSHNNEIETDDALCISLKKK